MAVQNKTPHLYIFSVQDNVFKDTGPASKLDRFLAHLSPHLTTNPPAGLVEKKTDTKPQQTPFAQDKFEG